MQPVSNTLSIKREPARVIIASKRIGRANWALEIVLFLISLAIVFGTLPGLLRTSNLLSIGSILALLVLLCGLLLVYRFLTLLTNTDTVEITPEQIKVSSGPLLAWDGGGSSIKRENLAGVEARSRITSSRQHNRSGATRTFDVLVTLTDGSTRTILGGSANPEPIHFIANEITTFYHL
jgi:hypothetical protein